MWNGKAIIGRMRLLNLASSAVRAVKHEPTVRRALWRSKRAGTSPTNWFSGVDDEEWMWLHGSKTIKLRPTVASLLPGLPLTSIQEKYTGSSGFTTLWEGFCVYRLFKRLYEAHVGPIRSSRGILDFGCGWGRTIRFFLKDVAPEKLTGVDHSEEAIQCCKETNKWCNFFLIGPRPPTPLASQSFDLIYLYSVFSHLPEEMHWSLLNEFHRLLAPGGLLIATTWRRKFIEHCRALRMDPELDKKPAWAKWWATDFLDTNATLAAYDRGEFCFAGYGAESEWSFWGEACIPKAYVEKHWSKIFDICDYIDDDKVCEQSVIVARKPI